MESTSRQPHGAPIIDKSPERRSTENSDPEITILEQEETRKSPQTHPDNTQITIIGGQKPTNLGTTAQNVHTPTIITINSSEDSSDDGIEEIAIQDNQSAGSHPHQGQKTKIQITKITGDTMIGTSQDTETINKRERSPQQEITILKTHKSEKSLRQDTDNHTKLRQDYQYSPTLQHYTTGQCRSTNKTRTEGRHRQGSKQ